MHRDYTLAWKMLVKYRAMGLKGNTRFNERMVNMRNPQHGIQAFLHQQASDSRPQVTISPLIPRDITA
jgi:hypothetical protein